MRRKDAARSPHFDHKIRNSGRIGARARKGRPCPVCNRTTRRKRTACHVQHITPREWDPSSLATHVPEVAA